MINIFDVWVYSLGLGFFLMGKTYLEVPTVNANIKCIYIYICKRLLQICGSPPRAARGLQGVRQRQGRLHRLQRPGKLHEDHGLHAHRDGVDRTEPADQHEP